MTFFRRHKHDVFEVVSFVVSILIGVAIIAWLASCGYGTPTPVEEKIERPLPPNVKQACARTIECGVFMEAQRGACEACLEHINKKELDRWIELNGPLPPLEQVDCATVAAVCWSTNIAECVTGQLWGPYGGGE